VLDLSMVQAADGHLLELDIDIRSGFTRIRVD
jgi:hypothetical protein